jgi:hypothetical protein
VQHVDDEIATGQTAPEVRLWGQSVAIPHGADRIGDGAATDAGASAVTSIANPIAVLRQIETSSTTIVRIPVVARGVLRLLMTSM